MSDNCKWHHLAALVDLYSQVHNKKIAGVLISGGLYHGNEVVTYREMLTEFQIDNVSNIIRDECGHFWKYYCDDWYVYKHGCGWVKEARA